MSFQAYQRPEHTDALGTWFFSIQGAECSQVGKVDRLWRHGIDFTHGEVGGMRGFKVH